MTPTEFRAALTRLHGTERGAQTWFADQLASLGDARPPRTILRNVQHLARLDRAAPIPWAVVVILSLMERCRAGDRA